MCVFMKISEEHEVHFFVLISPYLRDKKNIYGLRNKLNLFMYEQNVGICRHLYLQTINLIDD